MFHLFLGDADKADDLIIRIYDLVFISDMTEEREKELKRLNIDVPIEYRRGAEFMEYSEKVFREGIQQGIQEGIQIGEERGEKRGEEEGIVWSISKLVADGRPFDEAFDLLAKPGMDREKIRKRVETTDPSSRSPLSSPHSHFHPVPYPDILTHSSYGRLHQSLAASPLATHPLLAGTVSDLKLVTNL